MPPRPTPSRTALEGAEGVAGLSFDLISGTLTVEYDPRRSAPDALVRRIAKRAGDGCRSDRAGRTSSRWRAGGRRTADGL